jgi:hypothetical protein
MSNKSTWLIGAASGAVLSLTLVLACSDDSPGDADAAVCDCPAAEPPLAGRIVSFTASNAIAAGSVGVASVGCPVGGTVLGGACDVMTDDPNIQVQETQYLRGSQDGYLCRWSALNATVNNTGTVEVTCLVPAQ